MNLDYLGEQAREAARTLAAVSTEEKNRALGKMADALLKQRSAILAANAIDMQLAKQKNIAASFLDRLLLNSERIAAMSEGLRAIADLADPIGTVLAKIHRPNGLEIDRIRTPIGVIGVIYESRPNVTADAAGLCLKSGNAVILRGGSESFHSATAILTALHEGLNLAGLPINAVQMVATSDRSAIDEMLKMTKYIDVIIPRGGMKLIEYISAQTQIPVFKHLAGICHSYIHQDADKEMARKIVLNAKMRRTGICGATEILLVDEAVIHTHLPEIINELLQAGCEIRGDDQVVKLNPQIKHSQAQDYDTEFLDAILAVKVVKDISEAIRHIALHGTQHTDAIITENKAAAEKFLREVDSAIVMHNTSTQFADGGEFGMGAEIGIATGKLHARGPVGVEQLTIFKYVVRGAGQIRS